MEPVELDRPIHSGQPQCQARRDKLYCKGIVGIVGPGVLLSEIWLVW
jgi:hypothetical protein